MKKTINLNPSLQLDNEKPDKRFLYFWKYGRVFENLSLGENGMPLRLR